MVLNIDGHLIGPNHPTYFIADIAANHDGSLDRAKTLIALAKGAGADAAKFQHFKANRIVSGVGFDRLDGAKSHQAAWTRSVVDVYSDASVPSSWTPELRKECDSVGITFLSSPYDLDSVDEIDPFVPAFKVGSGDIDWLEELNYIAAKGKPVILATGAATMAEVERAMDELLAVTDQVALMQCNTNYTADEGNFDHLNLNVLQTYAQRWPGITLGLSDHTHGPAAVLGAVTLGARMIERHFTDDTTRDGPDHRFALDPSAWAEMVADTRRLERALGSTEKHVAANEIDTAVVQRRSIRASVNLVQGQVLEREHLDVLRPAPAGSIPPSDLSNVVGRALARPVAQGVELRWEDLVP